MMKRLLCFLMIFAMLSFPCIHAGAVDNSENVQKEVAMLRAFGILDSEIGSPNATMKRGDFFKIICSMIRLSDTAHLSSAGILNGVDTGDLGENENLTYEQAVTLLVRALGYDVEAEEHGGYPGGYILTAARLGITKGVSSREELKKSEIVKMVCSACDVEVLQLTKAGSERKSYSVIDGETVLAYYHDIYRIKGVVSSVNETCINSERGKKSDGVVIAGISMESGSVDAEPYLGMQVESYYRQERDRDPVLVYLTPLSKNEVITISADDIVREETTKEKLVYFTESSGKDKTAKISPVADMVYNRRGYVNYKAEDFMPEVGEVKLIDNDGDGRYDCIIVTDYQTLIVDRVSAVSSEIFPKYGGNLIDLSEVEEHIIRSTEGEELNLSEIKSGNVIFVKMSKDENYAEITVSQRSIEGKASTANSADKTLTIDGVEYKVNRQMYDYYETASKDIMAIDKNRTYYLDPAGRIAGYVSANSQDQMYGFLYKRSVNDLDEKLHMLVLDEEGQWNTYVAADRFTVNDTPIKKHDTALAMLEERQLLRLRLDDELKVKRIETAVAIPDGEDTEYFNKITFTKVYRTSNASFNSEFYLDGNLAIFKIPTGVDEETGEKYADDKNNYSVTGNEFEDYATYTVTLYDVDRNNRARIVTYEKGGGGKTLGNTVFLVDALGEVARGSEVFQSVSGIVVGQELDLTAEKRGIFDGLKCGDLIRFHMNDDGRVDAVGIVQRAEDERTEEEVLTSTLASSAAAILKGTIVHVDAEEGYIKIQGTDGTRALKVSGTKFALYDQKKEKVESAVCADVRVGDFVVILASSSAVRSVTMYR